MPKPYHTTRYSFTGKRYSNSIAFTLHRDSVSRDLFDLLYSGTADERLRVAAMLHLSSESVVPFSKQLLSLLIDATQDRSPTIRQYAIICLGKSGDATAVPALVSALQDPSNRLVSLYALSTLTGYPGIAIPAIIAIAANGTLYERREAIMALAAYKQEARAAIGLLRTLSASGEASIRPVARFALMKIE